MVPQRTTAGDSRRLEQEARGAPECSRWGASGGRRPVPSDCDVTPGQVHLGPSPPSCPGSSLQTLRGPWSWSGRRSPPGRTGQPQGDCASSFPIRRDFLLGEAARPASRSGPVMRPPGALPACACGLCLGPGLPGGRGHALQAPDPESSSPRWAPTAPHRSLWPPGPRCALRRSHRSPWACPPWGPWLAPHAVSWTVCECHILTFLEAWFWRIQAVGVAVSGSFGQCARGLGALSPS